MTPPSEQDRREAEYIILRVRDRFMKRTSRNLPGLNVENLWIEEISLAISKARNEQKEKDARISEKVMEAGKGNYVASIIRRQK